MGIQGLLPAIKDRLRPAHVSELRGLRVAVDAYAWIHKATYSCCVELCTQPGTLKWIPYCLSMVDMLLQHEIQLTLVFDGADLPAKKTTESLRSSNREENLAKGMRCLAGRDMDAARKHLAAAVNVTPLMAAQLIHELRASRPQVNCYVAPYEADAMLAYLSRYDFVDIVVSEDSDMIPYGCKDIVFKLDRGGSCQRLKLTSLFAEPIEGFDLTSFDQDMVVSMCVLAGCDYLPSVKGFGIKSSYKVVAKNRSPEKILRAMRLQGMIPLVSAYPGSGSTGGQLLEYELGFYKAFATFHHQTIYNIHSRRLDRLAAIDSTNQPACLQSLRLEDWDFLGPTSIEPKLAEGVARGLLHPESKHQFDLKNGKEGEAPIEKTGRSVSTQSYGFQVVASKLNQVSSPALKRKIVGSALLPEVPTVINLMEKENIASGVNKPARSSAEDSQQPPLHSSTQKKAKVISDVPNRSPYFTPGPAKTAIQSIQDLMHVRKVEAQQRILQRPDSTQKSDRKISKPHQPIRQPNSKNKESYISQFSLNSQPKLIGDKLVRTTTQTISHFFVSKNRDSLSSNASRLSSSTDLETISPVNSAPLVRCAERSPFDALGADLPHARDSSEGPQKARPSDSFAANIVMDLTSDGDLGKRNLTRENILSKLSGGNKIRQRSMVDFCSSSL